jgi:hypothetical protein
MVTEGPVLAEQVVKIDEPRRRMASMAGSPAQLENATRDLFRLSGGQSIPVEARVPSPELKPRVSPPAARAFAAPQPEPPVSERKKEASILFSLESLMKAAPPEEKAEQPDEQLWNMRAEAPLFGTAQDHALLTTPLDPPPRSAATDSMTMSSRRPIGVRLWPLLLAVVGGCGLILGVAAWIVLKPPPAQHAATLDTPVERSAAPAAEPAPAAAVAAPAPALVEPTAVPPAAAVKPAADEATDDEAKDDEAKEPVAAAEPKEAATKHSVPRRSTARAKKPVPPRATKAAAGPFNVEAAKAALGTAAAKAGSCRGTSGKGKVQLTFSPSGKVSSAELTDGPFAGTAAGKCALKHFKAAHVPPFSGAAQTVAKSFKIP